MALRRFPHPALFPLIVLSQTAPLALLIRTAYCEQRKSAYGHLCDCGALCQLHIPLVTHMPTTNTSSHTPLAFVRIAFLGWGFLMGAAGWWGAQLIHTSPLQSLTIEGLPFPITETVVLLGLLFVIALLFAGILLSQKRRAQKEDATAPHSDVIFGWALAEVGSFVGAGFLLLTGDPTVFAAGFALQLLTSFQLLPLSPSRA